MVLVLIGGQLKGSGGGGGKDVYMEGTARAGGHNLTRDLLAQPMGDWSPGQCERDLATTSLFHYSKGPGWAWGGKETV